MRFAAAALLVFALGCSVPGCKTQPVPPRTVDRTQVPLYDTVASAYNQRVVTLERLWARTVVRLKFIDGDGNPQSEQVEGHCQYVRPSKVLVSFHKVGHPLALLGSNEERFWWLELGKAKRAFVGTHAAATPERIAAAGLRVHPLDLMEMLGLTPLPESGEGCRVEWSTDGTDLIVTVPGKNAARRHYLDPDTYRPKRIELVGVGDKIEAFAELSKYEVVAMKAAGPEVIRPYIATHVVIDVDSGLTRVIMELSDMQNDPQKFRPIAFDFDRLIEANEVEEVRDLDKPSREAAER